jgi:hypothetical protein
VTDKPTPNATQDALLLLNDFRKRRNNFLGFNDYDRAMNQLRATVSVESAKLREPLRTIASRLFSVADGVFFLFHVCAWKIDYIAEALIHAIEAKNPIALANNTRALVEHLAALVAISNELEELETKLPGQNTEKAIDGLIKRAEVFMHRAYYGKSGKVSGKKEDQALHVNDCLEALTKEAPDIEEVYAFLCEYVHPNYGSNLLVSSGQLAAGRLVPPEEFHREVLDRLKGYCSMSMLLLRDRQLAQFGALIRLQGLVELCFVTGANVNNVFAIKPPKPHGDGKSRETAFFFKNARTPAEALGLCYEFLAKEKIQVQSRQSGGFSDGAIYDEFATDKGRIWFKIAIKPK